LKSYVGYFALLWFTWLQVALFDIRFGHDSAFERVCKAAQFGIMVGLAAEGTNYTLDDFTVSPFKNISLILMGSRIVLMIQYSLALFWLKDYKKALFPLLAHVGTMFVTAVIFLGLAFGFNTPAGINIIDGWYVVMGIEAAVVLFVSGQTSFLNFRRTNIIERLGLLTLIILGEGVMGLGEVVTKINDTDGVFASDVIGLLISAVM
jgi:low temperature requirement protein LtrA